MNDVPAKLGYEFPAEWHRHAATQLHWPSNRKTWPGDRLHRVETVFLDIIQVLHRYEPILLLAEPAAIRRAEKRLGELELDRGRIFLTEYPVNDVWARDCGPVFIFRKFKNRLEYAVTDWEFNSWGGKYSPFGDDNRIPEFISRRYNLTRFRPGMVMEGGSVETNGEGVLITTESVLLNPNRNPGLHKSEVEQALRNYLGVDKIIWLKAGLAGDDTDGHVDDLCRFLDRNTVLTVLAENRDDVNFAVLQENHDLLKRAQDLLEEPLHIETLPLPDTRIEGKTADGSEFVPASYANFYIANGVVLMPFYDKRYDEQARNLLKQYFPDREVAGIPSSDLVWGQGGIHCVTQQLYGLEIS
ncbi:MAG: agmatine deiminase family protein [Balneolaceae bacterium]